MRGAVAVRDDAEAEALVYALTSRRYTTIASVEHEAQARLATIRLCSPQGVKVDLRFASSGIEQETVERATFVDLPLVGALPTACSEELLAMKVLSMDDERLQDRLDARNILRDRIAP